MVCTEATLPGLAIAPQLLCTHGMLKFNALVQRQDLQHVSNGVVLALLTAEHRRVIGCLVLHFGEIFVAGRVQAALPANMPRGRSCLQASSRQHCERPTILVRAVHQALY